MMREQSSTHEGKAAEASAEFIARVQPIVLVGGRSRRFGRDKLREPWGKGVLVQRPIDALRAVFGRRVKVVGACHPDVASLADGVIDDVHPGVGPIGGIISALSAWGGPIMVLAGDMPGADADGILVILTAAERASCEADAALQPLHAVLARTDRLHPCAGVYFHSALEVLEARLASGDSRLIEAAELLHASTALVSATFAINVNSPSTSPTP